MTNNIVTLACFLWLTLLLFHGGKAYLVSVHVQMRHGDRTPTWFYPKDPFKDLSYWPEGLGELNSRGRHRIRKAGHLYHEIYESFLILTKGWPERAWSSPKNRAIQTASIFLESFLRDTGVSFEIIQNGRMLSTGVACNRSASLWLDHITGSADILSYIESNRNFIEYLEEETGGNYLNATPFTLRDLEFLATTLEIERDEYRLSVPEFARNEKNIELLDDLKRHAFYFDWRLPEIQRLRIGILLDEISNNIRSIIDNRENQQRFFLYSTHDVNLVLLMQALGVYDQIDRKPPTYSSAVIFEHHQPTRNSEYYIKLIYRQILSNSTDLDKFSVVDLPLIMPDCAEETVNSMCPWNRFQEVIEPLTIRPDEWEMECSRAIAIDRYWHGMLLILIFFFLQLFF